MSLCIAAIIFAVLIAVLFIPIGIGLGYEKGIFAIIKVGFIRLSKPITLGGGGKKKTGKPEKGSEGEPENAPERSLDTIIESLSFILKLAGDFRRFMQKKLFIEELDINVRLGTGDAASTAVLTGASWGLLANIISLLDLLAKVKNPCYNVEPRFNEATFSVTAHGILVSRPAYIIAVAIVLAYKYAYKYSKYNKTKEETT